MHKDGANLQFFTCLYIYPKIYFLITFFSYGKITFTVDSQSSVNIDLNYATICPYTPNFSFPSLALIDTVGFRRDLVRLPSSVLSLGSDMESNHVIAHPSTRASQNHVRLWPNLARLVIFLTCSLSLQLKVN